MNTDEKIVIFDWGGVIESHREGKYSLNTAITNFIKHFNNDVDENGLIEKYFDVCTNKIEQGNKAYNWFEKIKYNFNLECIEEEFYKFYEEEFNRIEYYKEVVEYAHSLKNKCKIGILSNLGSVDKQRLNKQVGLSKFDYVWLSFELKCSKPNEKVYKIVEEDCKIEPNNILFIDDFKENLKPAQTRGWNTCNACGYELEKIQKSVSEFLDNN